MISGVFSTDQTASLLELETAGGYAESEFEKHMPFDELVIILNDYGFFLEQSSDPRALGVLLEVVRLNPERTVAWLNMADAQWKGGKRSEAAASYREYVRQMRGKRLETQIPPRAAERAAGAYG